LGRAGGGRCSDESWDWDGRKWKARRDRAGWELKRKTVGVRRAPGGEIRRPTRDLVDRGRPRRRHEELAAGKGCWLAGWPCACY
jgi:hypothetical protein